MADKAVLDKPIETIPEVVAEVAATVLVRIHDQVMEVTEEAFNYLCAWVVRLPTLGLAFHRWVVDEENAALGKWFKVTPAEHAVPLEPETTEAPETPTA